MNERKRGEEHLRMIRILMERAAIHRAISAPTALVGGLLSIFAAVVSWRMLESDAGAPLPGGHFLVVWLLVLLVTLVVNVIFLAQAARRRREPLVSPALKLAARALLPPVLTAGVISVPLGGLDLDNYLVALIWTTFYGLALLATAHFAPRSLVVLGWAFLLTSLGLYALPFLLPATAITLPTDRHATLLMGATFGLYHLIYAAAVWRGAWVEAGR